MKLTLAKAKRILPFTVRVSVKKYEGWRRHPYYTTMGGLWGLCVGAPMKREVTVKICINQSKLWDVQDVPYTFWSELDRLMELHFDPHYEKVESNTSPFWLCYISTEIHDFGRKPTKEDIKKLRKEYKKWAEEVMVKKIIPELIEDEYLEVR